MRLILGGVCVYAVALVVAAVTKEMPSGQSPASV
jgi:hypothetical protein